ncbi:MAG: hypothetical protein WA323_07110 [Candidatus Nitrosopolaris sp.]
MYLNNALLILKTPRALIMLTVVGVMPVACTQTAFSQMPQQRQILTCDHSGFPSCYSTGYDAGLLNRGTFSSCGGFLNSLGSPTHVHNYCSGFSAAQQQQQQHK